MPNQPDKGREQNEGEKKQPNFPTHPVNFQEFAAWVEQERHEPDEGGDTTVRSVQG